MKGASVHPCKPTTRSILTTLVSVASFLAHPPRAGAQATPQDGSFEINGDYGSVFLADGSIQSPGPVAPLRTRFVWQQAGKAWVHASIYSYMGLNSY
jgi:hypothetical protein